MILNKLVMKNFRQFCGVQQVEFSSSSKDKGKNVTVIFGENGRGKTGIFRAIMFCLYGEQRLSQDEDVSQKEIFLVNSPALHAAVANGGYVDAYVELHFDHKNERYSIKRSLEGFLDGTDRIEQIGISTLSYTQKNGNTKNYNDPEDIKQIINNILDKNVREYFLFDGEKIQRLTLSSAEQRREIARGIKNLLNIDALEKAIKVTQKLKKELNTELSKRATGEYKKIVYQLNQLDEKCDPLKDQLNQNEEEQHKATIEKKEIDKKLEECQEVLHLLKERVDIEDRLRSEEDNSKNLLMEMKTRTGKASLLLLSKTIDRVFVSIDQKKQKGEIPSEIRKDLIEKILLEKKCICNRDIVPGSDHFKQIILWKNKTTDVDLESSALDMWRYLSGIRGHRDDIALSVETLLHKYANSKNEIEKLRTRIEYLNDQIGSSERQDTADLEKLRNNVEKKLIKLEAEKISIDKELNELESEYARLSEQRKLLEKDEQIKNELVQRANLADETCNALQTVYDEFTNEIKQKIASAANKYFIQLLDREGRENLHSIVVKSDYSLQIHDKWGKPFLANISAGQRQIMSISFIAALAKVAASEMILEMPLFMDTPFGRLSLEHRKNLLEKIPDFCAQWILLATDTEFRKQEAALLKKSGHWGRFYLLRGSALGVTQVEERNIEDAQSILHDNLEVN